MTTAAAVRRTGTSFGTEPVQEPMPPLKQRIAFVSGGMGGIGSAVCRRLARSGARVVAGCLPGYEKKDQWLAKMRGEGLQVYAAEGDVDDYESCADMFYQIGSVIGPVDIIVNNSSVNALKGQFGQTNYSAAKAGMHGFSKALAQEVVKKGVTVNTVSPGYVETDMVRAMKPEILNSIDEQIPMGRLAQPEEVAGLVAYLASEEAGYITGANISINGGLYMV